MKKGEKEKWEDRREEKTWEGRNKERRKGR